MEKHPGWRILTPRHAPKPSLDSHLTFALKYEGLDLAILKRLFLAVGPRPVAAMVKATPTGKYAAIGGQNGVEGPQGGCWGGGSGLQNASYQTLNSVSQLLSLIRSSAA